MLLHEPGRLLPFKDKQLVPRQLYSFSIALCYLNILLYVIICDDISIGTTDSGWEKNDYTKNNYASQTAALITTL